MIRDKSRSVRKIYRPRAEILLTLLLLFMSAGWARAEEERKDWVFIPALAYTTDTKFLAGAQVIRFFGCEEQGEGDDCRRSNLAAALMFTQKKQMIAQLVGDHYLGGLSRHLVWELAYRKFPSTFYGLGRDTPLELAEDYTPSEFLFEVSYNRRFGEHWELGLEGEYGSVDFLERKADGLLEVGGFPGAESGDYAGLGLRAAHDDRDSVWFPRSGQLLEARARFFREELGSDYDWDSYSLNLRRYVGLDRLPGAPVVALQLAMDHALGDVPFHMLPSLGGDNQLRGYPGSRFRDKARVLGQMEIRLSELLGPLGLVLFLGYGDVAPCPCDLDLSRGKLGWGVGGRMLYDPTSGLHLRMDYGLGESGESSFTITIGEAF